MLKFHGEEDKVGSTMYLMKISYMTDTFGARWIQIRQKIQKNVFEWFSEIESKKDFLLSIILRFKSLLSIDFRVPSKRRTKIEIASD